MQSLFSIEDEKKKLLNVTELEDLERNMSVNSLRVLASRYLNKNGKGEIIERPRQLFERVAILITIPDILYDNEVYSKEKNNYFDCECKEEKIRLGGYNFNEYHVEALERLYNKLNSNGHMKMSYCKIVELINKGYFNNYIKNIQEYYDLMASGDFLPNTPTLLNGGNKLGQLSACFVLPINDNMESIMKAATDSAMIFKSGGGVGINYSNLRPEGSMVASTTGVSSGPVSFMEIVDKVADVVKQGGKRRAANMGILNSTHPDVKKFIIHKKKPGILENFNISVGIDKEFFECLYNKKNYKLSNGEEINPEEFIDMIAHSAWESAEPGMIFLDRVNENNPLKESLGDMKSTNPCGEIPLYPYESCNLGSINITNFVVDTKTRNVFDWQRFAKTIEISTRFLDNVIDVNKYPIPELEFIQKTRRIGLGIMGLADALYKLRLPYNSKEGFEFMENVSYILYCIARDKSVEMAKERGSYPLCKEITPKRNVFITSIAPTGSISMIADTSNGIEPAFALVFEKRVSVGSFFYTNKYFEQALKERGIYNENILKKVADNYGSCKEIPEIPEDLQSIFVTAMDIHHYDHIVAQAKFQKNIDNAISKTINLPGDATIQDVKLSYLLAHELGLKGITVYRDGSRHEQVLHITGKNNGKKIFLVMPSVYAIEYIAENTKNLNVTEFVSEQISEKYNNEIKETSIVFNESMICPTCGMQIEKQGKCSTCSNCGWSACSSS